jgi:CelD/BcsL family acetyltransferase involved in cellulose biosynthesis
MALLPQNLAPLSSHTASPAPRAASADTGTTGTERQVVTIRTMEELERFLPEWRQFLEWGARGAAFDSDPVNVEVALKEIKGLSPLLVVVRRGGRIECVAPFYVHRARFRLKLSVLTLASLPVRMLKLFGEQIQYAADCNLDECFEAVFAELQRHRKLFNFIIFYKLDCSEELWKLCSDLPARGIPFRAILASAGIEKVHQVRISGTHEAYLASLTPSTRQELRRKTRRFFDNGRGKLVKVTRPEQVKEFLDHLDTVFRNSWQAKTFGYYPRNTEPQQRRFERFAAESWLRSYVLLYDGQPIAFESGCQYGGRYCAGECGFDPSKSPLGPGSVLMHLLIEDLFKEDRPELLDFGVGDAAYKRSFGNTEQEMASLYLAPRNVWRCLLALQKTLDYLFVRFRSLLVRSRLDSVVRRILKHKRQ